MDQLKGQYITRITNNQTVAPIPAVLQNNINQANLSSSSPAPPPPPPPQMQVATIIADGYERYTHRLRTYINL